MVRWKLEADEEQGKMVVVMMMI